MKQTNKVIPQVFQIIPFNEKVVKRAAQIITSETFSGKASSAQFQ
jgi:hypothetical protein